MTEPPALVLASSSELAPLATSAYAAYMVQLGAASSRLAMRSKLAGVLRDFFHYDGEPVSFPWHTLRYLHTAALRAWLLEHRAPATVRSTLTAVRGILRQCYRLELMAERDYRLAVDLPSIRGERIPPGRCVPVGELRAMFLAAADQRPELAARNAAILAVLFGGGLRRAELVALDEDHVSSTCGVLRVMGKGNKERAVHLPAGAVLALADWYAIRGEGPGPLFWSTDHCGTQLAIGQRLSTGTVRNLVQRLAKLAGVAKLTPHDLRRSFVSELLDAGADISTVAGMAGHASVTTTQRYDRRGERAKVRASELLCVPFEGGPKVSPSARPPLGSK